MEVQDYLVYLYIFGEETKDVMGNDNANASFPSFLEQESIGSLLIKMNPLLNRSVMEYLNTESYLLERDVGL